MSRLICFMTMTPSLLTSFCGVRRAPHRLDDKRDGALHGVSVRDRQRDALPHLRVNLKDDELPRLTLPGNQRRLDFHLENLRRQLAT